MKRKSVITGVMIGGGVMMLAANISEKYWYNSLFLVLGIVVLIMGLDLRFGEG